MTLQTGGPRQKPYLQCISQESGKCKTKAKPKYGVFEELILKAAADNRFAVQVNHADADKVRQRIEELSVEVTRDERGRDRLLASFITAIETDESIKTAIDGLRTRIEGSKKEIAHLKIELERMTSSISMKGGARPFRSSPTTRQCARRMMNSTCCEPASATYSLTSSTEFMCSQTGISLSAQCMDPYGNIKRAFPILLSHSVNSGSACYLEYYPGATQLVEPPWLEYDCKDYPRFLKWSSIDVARRGTIQSYTMD